MTKGKAMAQCIMQTIRNMRETGKMAKNMVRVDFHHRSKVYMGCGFMDNEKKLLMIEF